MIHGRPLRPRPSRLVLGDDARPAVALVAQKRGGVGVGAAGFLDVAMFANGGAGEVVRESRVRVVRDWRSIVER